MHLYKFTVEQKHSFLDLVKKLIEADGVVGIDESNFLTAMQNEIGLKHDFSHSKRTIDELLKPFNTRATKVWLLQELMGMGYIDDHLASEELAFLKEVANICGFTNNELRQIQDIVVRTKKLLEDTNELIKAKK